MITTRQSLTALLLGSIVFSAHAAVSEEEAQRLGQDLTPIGAEKAGNEAGTIPAWDGGFTDVPAGFEEGGHYPDPFADDERLFTITGNNYKEYEENLSPGQIALLTRYPGYKMHVYPTRRSTAYPQGLYDETRANATKVELVESGNGFEGTTGGVPFPIPESGLEAIWNHLTHYRGDTYKTTWAQAAVTKGGDYTLEQINEHAVVTELGLELRVLGERPGLSSRNVVEQMRDTETPAVETVRRDAQGRVVR